MTDSVDFDWIAFEMLGDAQQPALDSFLNAAEGSREYRLALGKLCEHFSGSWRLNEEFPSPEDNYFIRVLMNCRQRGKKVYALELSDPGVSAVQERRNGVRRRCQERCLGGTRSEGGQGNSCRRKRAFHEQSAD